MRNSGFSYREQLGPEHDGLAVLDLLASRYAHSTRETWLERLDAGEVELRGRVARGDDRVRQGDWLVWHRPAWDEPEVPRDFTVIHEDAELLAVCKPSGLPTAPAGGFYVNTLQELVRARDPAWTPMHRLGRATSGVVLFARTDDARAKLHAAFREHRVEKRYLALASGALEPQVIHARIGRVLHPRLGELFAASEQGRAAESIVERVERRGDATLAEVRITTGRPHQIRIHLAYVGHPLVGDPLYEAGGVPRDALPGEGGYLLHAWKLALAHPRTGTRLELVAEPPEPLRPINSAENLTNSKCD